MDLKELQELQAEYDKKYWTHNGPLVKVRHIALHMGKMNGKAAGYVEGYEHGSEPDPTIMKTEVIPDLLFYALQLANELGVDLEAAYHKRVEQNTKRNLERAGLEKKIDQ